MSIAKFFEVLDQWTAEARAGELPVDVETRFMHALSDVREGLTDAENLEVDAKLNARLDSDHAPDRRFLEREDGRRLYAAAIERFAPSYKLEVFHIHAHDAGEARAHYSTMYHPPHHRIVAVGPALGFFAGPDGSVSTS